MTAYLAYNSTVLFVVVVAAVFYYFWRNITAQCMYNSKHVGFKKERANSRYQMKKKRTIIDGT